MSSLQWLQAISNNAHIPLVAVNLSQILLHFIKLDFSAKLALGRIKICLSAIVVRLLVTRAMQWKSFILINL